MNHPFGDLLRQYRARKAGLTLMRLAHQAGYDKAILVRMGQGQKDLTGPSGRDHVVRVIVALQAEGVLATLAEANALLTAARLPPLFEGVPDEASLLQQLNPAINSVAPASHHATTFVPHRTNLPKPLTRFIGRERQLAALIEHVPVTRLLTLTGAGGVGKTRLAIELGVALADAAASTLPDGVWLVELAPLTDPTLLHQTILASIGLPQQPDRLPSQILVAYLVGRRLLLILDNCEHLIDTAAETVEMLLSACPQLHILATSREALRVTGELTWRVPSLSTPNPAHLPSLERVSNFEAIALFINHATAAQPGFILSPGNVTAIAQICYRLDGIPLAIEIAAAQTAAMTAQEIASRLDDRFTLLMDGRRSGLPRHRTLHAAIEWSWQLLSALNQRLLTRLSMFADGCQADAAQAVCSDSVETGDLVQVLPTLLQLVRKSLVVANTDGRDGQTRYRLLETVRQFAAVWLDDRERERLYERHMDFLIRLCTRFPRERLMGQVKTAYFLRLDAELGNLRALLEWARGRHDEGVTSLRLAAAAHWLWYGLGHQAEGRAWLEDALTRGHAAPPEVRLPALYEYGNAFRVYPIDRLEAIAEACLVLARDVGDRWYEALALRLLGDAVFWRGKYEQGRALIEQHLSLLRELGDFFYTSMSLTELGRQRLAIGDRVKAVSNLKEGLAFARLTDHLSAQSSSLLALHTVEPVWARTLCEEILAEQRAAGHERGMAQSLQTLGQIQMAAGEYTEAEETLAESHHLWQQMGFQLWNGSGGGAAGVLLELARLAFMRGQYAIALDQYRICLDLGHIMGFHGYLANAHLWAGYASLELHDFVLATRHFRDSLQKWPGPYFRPLALAALARLAEEQGDNSRAARLYGAAATQESAVQIAVMMSTSISHLGRLIYDRDVASARSRLIDLEWARAWAEGQGMTAEQSMEYAQAGL